MDAYDIFRKITKGARFSKQYNSISDKTAKSSLKSNDVKPVIKKEEEFEDVQESTEIVSQSEAESAPITLLGGYELTKRERGKKRKILSEKESTQKKQLLEKEEVNHYRNVHNINVVGRQVPEPAKSFQDFSVDSDLTENLKKCGYAEPTAIQTQAVPIMLQNRQILACAPTGSGKTAAFLVPIIQSLEGPKKDGFRALILCPTRELAKQTHRECLRLAEGRNFRVHIISKIKLALTQYGPKSTKKYGNFR